MKEIYLAGGCFWGLQEIRPVYDAEQDKAGKPLAADKTVLYFIYEIETRIFRNEKIREEKHGIF